MPHPVFALVSGAAVTKTAASGKMTRTQTLGLGDEEGLWPSQKMCPWPPPRECVQGKGLC